MRGDADLLAVWRLARARCAVPTPFICTPGARPGSAGWWHGGPEYRRSLTRRMDRVIGPGWRTRLIYRKTCSRRTAAIAPGIVSNWSPAACPRDRVVLIPAPADLRRVQRGWPPAPCAARRRRRRGRAAEHRRAGAAQRALTCCSTRWRRWRTSGLRPRLWVAGESGPERASLAAQAERPRGRRAGGLVGAARRRRRPVRRRRRVRPALARGGARRVAALEAMAAGRAVVASAVGSLADARSWTAARGCWCRRATRSRSAPRSERVLREPALRAGLGAAGPTAGRRGFLAEQDGRGVVSASTATCSGR